MLEPKYISPIVHMTSSYNAYKQLCIEKFSQYDPDRCALSVSLLPDQEPYYINAV
jgi:hypothetical protein